MKTILNLAKDNDQHDPMTAKLGHESSRLSAGSSSLSLKQTAAVQLAAVALYTCTWYQVLSKP